MDDIHEMVDACVKDIDLARQYFNNATEPDLVDAASLYLEGCELRLRAACKIAAFIIK